MHCCYYRAVTRSQCQRMDMGVRVTALSHVAEVTSTHLRSDMVEVMQGNWR